MIAEEHRHPDYPSISESLSQAGAKFPEFLEKNFARILHRVESSWGKQETVNYLDALFLGTDTDRTERKGFPAEAMTELVLLKQVHQRYFPSVEPNPFDPFSGTEALFPIAEASRASAPDIVEFERLAVSKPSGAPDTAVFAGPDTSNSAMSTTTSTSADGLALLPMVDAHSERKRAHGRIEWPVIHTLNELFDFAKLQHNGESLYALQDKPVGEILIHYCAIEERTLRVVRNMQKKPQHKNQPLGEILVEIGIIKQDELTRALHVQAGVLMVDLSTIAIPAETLKIIPSSKAREKQVVPIGSYHDTLYLAVANPFTFADRAFFAFLTGMKIILVYAPQHEIINRLNIYGAGKSSTEAKEEFLNLTKKSLDFSPSKSSADEISYTDISENDSTIINLVNQMVSSAIEAGASDIHIELFQDSAESNIRFRRDGGMEHFSSFPSGYHNAVVSRIKIMASLDISEKRRPQDGKISLSMPNGQKVDLRVATIPAMRGTEFVTIRILASGEPRPLGEMGMSERDTNLFRELFLHPYGLILVCGPTGSGKTTTLHSVLKELNTDDRKIWTAEDPVEIVQKNLCQVQINSKIGMTFATVLRSFLRADPDVIMIGEMRDQETAKVALEASMTGHLVLSTLHTNSAAETVARLLDLDIDPYNLSDALLVILAQRLARKLCPACAKREEASAHDLDNLANEFHQSGYPKAPSDAQRDAIIQRWRDKYSVNGKLYLRHPVGCKSCNGGYKGRVGIYELLEATPPMRNLIRHKSAAVDYLAAGMADGMRTLKQDGIEKVMAGITDMIQVRTACV